MSGKSAFSRLEGSPLMFNLAAYRKKECLSKDSLFRFATFADPSSNDKTLWSCGSSSRPQG
ncbi:hypothetical protein SERLA73DRAFT_131894 [Serpula lacrymans var. lacrymans S7.3]|uniref:Uncharacterized protein n=2 Tax=Serpula lacrymans var. lacrymans TaxID=341189 RepID=F8PQD5_SERL3|nr:uncharacterized protein SERLADRAFT_381590 [Serpula lacrymans var. lacrymans S7.9]EGO01548.1 hypothetical protein SERLA73DRAFT_131894 [Serpula lacrymans var. lacrymans S7.3]EGO27202.1 hypothetical protein SERLADRAFT_381590 [Serpula lacrymans var. lacrymans S7.9]